MHVHIRLAAVDVVRESGRRKAMAVSVGGFHPFTSAERVEKRRQPSSRQAFLRPIRVDRSERRGDGSNAPISTSGERDGLFLLGPVGFFFLPPPSSPETSPVPTRLGPAYFLRLPAYRLGHLQFDSDCLTRE